MVISRRSLLAATAASVLVARPAMAAPRPVLVGTGKNGGKNATYILDSGGRIRSSNLLPARGHGAAVTPDRDLAVTIARRPGRFALAVNVRSGAMERRFSCPKDRHFCGHGFFTPDGRLFLATENDFDNERGVIGIYDTRAGFRRIGEFDTSGVGPHEAILLRDGRTIAVANGGIATHPDFPRQKLNIPDMRPSLSYIDLATGVLIQRVTLPPKLHKLSIRHLAEDWQGAVWFACQYEGAKSDCVPLLGAHKIGQTVRLLDFPSRDFSYMHHYCGSITASGDGGTIVVTSPRAGRLIEIAAATGWVISEMSVPDICGLAPVTDGYLASDGNGSIWRDGEKWHRSENISWDNHLGAIG